MKDIKKAVTTRFPELSDVDVDSFVNFYFACIEAIEQSKIPVDISIRQLNNVIDLYIHGLPLKEAIEDGLSSILEAVSQPKSKEAFHKLAQAVWKELMNEKGPGWGNILKRRFSNGKVSCRVSQQIKPREKIYRNDGR
jgi:hypothetical protein